MHIKLFIPGPTEVIEENLQKLATPQVGHRHKLFVELYNSVQPKLQKLLYTQQPVLYGTCSSTGLMEAAVRNTTKKRVLNVTCGAFSERWHKITVNNGLEADTLATEWGTANKPEDIDKALATGKYDVITTVLNETSTGVMNPYEEYAEVLKKYPDVIWAVDAVSGMAGVKIEFDKLGMDICLAGLQKAFALPAGAAVMAVSEKAFERAKTVEHRGFYFDILDMLKYHNKGQTPSTPAIPQLFALDNQLSRFLDEGLEAHFARHQEMADFVRNWAETHFELYAEEGYRSNTLTTIKNTKGFSIADLNKELEKHNVTISNGYGKLKETQFRIAHMGDCQMEDLKELLSLIDKIWNL